MTFRADSGQKSRIDDCSCVLPMIEGTLLGSYHEAEFNRWLPPELLTACMYML